MNSHQDKIFQICSNISNDHADEIDDLVENALSDQKQSFLNDLRAMQRECNDFFDTLTKKYLDAQTNAKNQKIIRRSCFSSSKKVTIGIEMH